MAFINPFRKSDDAVLDGAKLSPKEIKDLISKAAKKADSEVASMSGEKGNPTVAPMYNQAIGRAAAFNDVLSALNGNVIDLKMSAN